MRKVSGKGAQREGKDLRREYDFAGGVRGKHYRAMQAGYTITIHKADGTTVVKDIKPPKGMIFLEPDVREYFPDSEAVNATLRSLVRLIPRRGMTVARRPQGITTKRRVPSGIRSKPTN